MTGEQSPRKPMQIDVDDIFKRKNPRVYKLLPGFVISYIKRAIHQEEINAALVKYHDITGLDFISQALNYLGTEYTVDGEENIPSEGRFIFVANHPLGGLDGMIFFDLIGRHHRNVKTISNDLLLNIKNLESLFIPVNKHGRQTVEYAKLIDEAYRSDNQVFIFPAGLCSRMQGKKIMDLDWKKHFIKKAIDYKRDIIPVHFGGRNSSFFYHLANLRKFLGIGANIEMFYLPDEMFRQRNRKIHVTVGKPIPYTHFDKSKTHAEWAEEVKKTVYRLTGK